MDSWMLLILNALVVITVIVFIIVALFRAFLCQKHHRNSGLSEHNWYLQLSLSRKDAMSQWFLVLGSLALANMAYAVNNNLGGPLSWRTILLIAVLILAAMAYFGRSFYCAAIGIVGFLVWWVAQTTFWQIEITSHVVLTALVGLMWLAILLYALGFWQMQKTAWKRFGAAYVVIGLLLANFLLFAFSTQSGLQSLEEIIASGRVFDVWQNTIALFLVGGWAMLTLLYCWSKKIVLIEEASFVLGLFLLFGLLIVLPEQSLIIGKWPGQLTGAGLFWAAVFNFTLLFEILGVIFAGYRRREVWMINFGAVLLIIFVAEKYFDWFFKFMDKSVFFIIAGIMLFVIGWAMERGWRYLAQSITSNQQNQ